MFVCKYLLLCVWVRWLVRGVVCFLMFFQMYRTVIGVCIYVKSSNDL